MKVLAKDQPVVRYRKNNDYDGYECWNIILDGKHIGTIERKSQGRTRVDAFVNNKNIYSNGFDKIDTAKMYVKDFIHRIIKDFM